MASDVDCKQNEAMCR